MRPDSYAAALGGRDPRELVRSDDVARTPVFRSNGKRIGRIERLMIDRETGRVAFAVMRFGGILGIGVRYYTLPWLRLRYDDRRAGYVVNVTEAQLACAPRYASILNWILSRPYRDMRHPDQHLAPPSWGV